MAHTYPMPHPNWRTVKVRTELFREIEKKVANSDGMYDSISEYVSEKLSVGLARK